MNKIYKITWTDASGVVSQADENEWFSVCKAVKLSQCAYDDHNVNVGFIIHKNKRFLVIAGSRAGTQYADISMIPICNVFKIKELK